MTSLLFKCEVKTCILNWIWLYLCELVSWMLVPMDYWIFKSGFWVDVNLHIWALWFSIGHFPFYSNELDIYITRNYCFKQVGLKFYKFGIYSFELWQVGHVSKSVPASRYKIPVVGNMSGWSYDELDMRPIRLWWIRVKFDELDTNVVELQRVWHVSNSAPVSRITNPSFKIRLVE